MADGRWSVERHPPINFLISTASLWITSEQEFLKSFPRSLVTTAGMVLEKKAVRFASRHGIAPPLARDLSTAPCFAVLVRTDLSRLALAFPRSTEALPQ